MSDGPGRAGRRVAAPDSASDEVGRLQELVASLREQNRQLEYALESRIVIEQAKGILAERYRLPVEEAFELLRRGARNHRVRLHALAAEVVASPETPREISVPSASS